MRKVPPREVHWAQSLRGDSAISGVRSRIGEYGSLDLGREETWRQSPSDAVIMNKIGFCSNVKIVGSIWQGLGRP